MNQRKFWVCTGVLSATAAVVWTGVGIRIADARVTKRVAPPLLEDVAIPSDGEKTTGGTEEMTQFRCGTPSRSDDVKAFDIKMMSRFNAKYRGGIQPRDPGTVIIPVYVHVILSSAGTGQVTDAQINAQIKILNIAYAGRDSRSLQTGQVPSAQSTANTPFRFRLMGIDRTTSDTYFNAVAGSTADRNMKTALKQGGRGTLNLYTSLADGNLGYAYLPSDVASGAVPEVFDGVVLLYSSFPGGTFTPYNYGDTATHEIGHWLGLEHTFEGGCATDATNGGDFVADTPAEASSYFGMPTGTRDTCTAIAGRDPVENFMDYTDDDGMFQFTTGQSARMDAQHALYRSTL